MRSSIFDRFPAISLAIVVIGLSLMLDVITAQIFLPKAGLDIRTPHHYYHHSLRPHIAGTDRWGTNTYPFYTDNFGFRSDTIRTHDLSSRHYRILLMGDSHTEGVGLPFEETFAGKLQNFYRGIEILNAGVVSYSPKLYHLKTKYLIEELGLQFDGIYVFIDISDIQNAYAYADFNPSSPSSWQNIHHRIVNYLRRNSALYTYLSQNFKTRSKRNFYEKITNKDIDYNHSIDLYEGFFDHFDDEVLLGNPDFHTTISEWFSDESLYNRWGKTGVKLMTNEMEKLIQLCRKNDIEVVITVHPWRNNVQRGNINDRHVHYWREFANSHEVRFINLYSAFITGEHPDSVIKTSYFPNDNHWSMEGHHRVFDKLRPFIPKPTADSHHFDLITALHAYEKENFSDAKKLLTHHLQNDSANIDALYYAALVDMKMGNFEQAQHQLEILSSMNLSYPNLKLTYEQIPIQRQIYALNQAIDHDSSEILLLQRGQKYLELHNYALARKDFVQVNKLNPQAKEPYYYLGLIDFRFRKRFKMASTLFNRAIQIDPNYREVYLERADLYEFLGNRQLAEKDRERAEVLDIRK